MKTDEFIKENKIIAEAKPYGMGSRMGAALTGALGSERGKAISDIAKSANDLYTEFKQYALRAGLADEKFKLTNVPTNKIVNWFLSKNLQFPGDLRQPSFNLEDPKIIKSLFTSAAQDIYRDQYTTKSKQAAAPTAPAPAAPKTTSAAPKTTSAAPASDYQTMVNILRKRSLSRNQKKSLIQMIEKMGP